jgi:hypothetical protein
LQAGADDAGGGVGVDERQAVAFGAGGVDVNGVSGADADAVAAAGARGGEFRFGKRAGGTQPDIQREAARGGGLADLIELAQLVHGALERTDGGGEGAEDFGQAEAEESSSADGFVVIEWHGHAMVSGQGAGFLSPGRAE